jgi:hypothetical protein
MADQFGGIPVAPASGTDQFGGIPVDQQQQPQSAMDHVVNFAKNFWGDLANSGQALIHTVAHPIDTFTGIGAAQDAVRLKAQDAIKRGDYVEAARHALNYIIPMVGPGIDARADQAQSGDVSGALGGTTSMALQLAAPELLKGSIPVTPRIATTTPQVNAALDYVESKGAAPNAAARTDNLYVKNIQKAADTTPIGAAVARGAAKQTTAALQAESDALATRTHPQPIVPEQAGEGVSTSLRQKMQGFHATADTAYDDFRKIEADPANVQSVQQGTKEVPVLNAQGNPIPGQTRTVPVMEDVPLPTDVRGIKMMLAPLVAQMDKWMEPAKRNVSAGYTAAKSLLNGPDYIQASVAEDGLGGMKDLAREGEGRNAGIAKLIAMRLQGEVDKAVGAANDPRALQALQDGRSATADAYGVKGILKQLRDEPVQAFQQMTWAKDAGIDRLRQVAQEAPAEMPKVGRAWLEDLFTKAQAEGGFGGADGMYRKWQTLGPETKKILFQNDPGLVSDLDKFFLGAKKLAENPNPSGSGVLTVATSSGALIVTHPAVGIPLAIGAGALSKMMHTRAGVQLLTRGLRMPMSAPARAITAGQILKMAGGDVTPVSLPKAADATDPNQPNGPLATARPPQ